MNTSSILALVFVAILVIHTLLREVGVEQKWLPLTFIGWIGEGAEWIYYRVGRGIGYLWYWWCKFFNFIARHLWDAMWKTAGDLYDAIKPYFNFALVWKGIKEVGWNFWTNHRSAIRRGITFSIVAAGVAIILATATIPSPREMKAQLKAANERMDARMM